MHYNDGSTRVFPNSADQKEVKYDEDCEDEPAVKCEEDMDPEECESEKWFTNGKYCPPKVELGVFTIAEVGSEYGDEDDVFGAAHNDVGDEISNGGTMISGGATIPVISTVTGQATFGLVTIDGQTDKSSGLWIVEYEQHLNKSKGFVESVQTVKTMGVHGVISPSSPRLTAACSAMFVEQLAPDATAMAAVTDFDAEAAIPSTSGKDMKEALMAFHHVRPTGEKLSEFMPWHNGWPVEARVEDAKGSVSVHKHYAFGRGSWDGVTCMPDGVTCLFWGEGFLFAFMAEEPHVMDYGRLLYARKVKAASGEDGPKIVWQEMGIDSDSMYPKKGGDDEETKDDPVGVPEGLGQSLAHDDEVKDAFAWPLNPLDKDAEGYAMHVAARLETVAFAKSIGAQPHFEGLTDVSFSREFSSTGDKDDRGAIFLSFSKLNADQQAVFPGDTANGAVFHAALTSWKDATEVDEEDWEEEGVPEYELTKISKMLPGELSNVASGADNGIVMPTSVAWSHFHNMLFVGTDAGNIIGVEMDAEWLKTSNTMQYQTVYTNGGKSPVKGLMWNQNMIGNGDAYLTFGVDGEWDIIGPFRMRNYMTSVDTLMNVGCPRFDKEHHLYAKFKSQEWPIPEEED